VTALEQAAVDYVRALERAAGVDGASWLEAYCSVDRTYAALVEAVEVVATYDPVRAVRDTLPL